MEIEKKVEVALLEDGYSREAVRGRMGALRRVMFFSDCRVLGLSRYRDYLRVINDPDPYLGGTRNSIPYKRVMKEIMWLVRREGEG